MGQHLNVHCGSNDDDLLLLTSILDTTCHLAIFHLPILQAVSSIWRLSHGLAVSIGRCCAYHFDASRLPLLSQGEEVSWQRAPNVHTTTILHLGVRFSMCK